MRRGEDGGRERGRGRGERDGEEGGRGSGRGAGQGRRELERWRWKGGLASWTKRDSPNSPPIARHKLLYFCVNHSVNTPTFLIPTHGVFGLCRHMRLHLHGSSKLLS